MTRLIDWSARHGGFTRLHFPENEEFEKCFVVLAQDEAAARSFLTGSRIDWLCGQGRLFNIETGGDTATVQRNYSSQPRETEENLRILFDGAQGLVEAFGRG